MWCLCRGVGVMEDEGLQQDHTSGLAATDGTWRHIAVTWESSTGQTVLYDNGRKVRRVLECMSAGGHARLCMHSQKRAMRPPARLGL